MKKFILLSFVVHFSLTNSLYSQSVIGNIAFSLVMPEEINGFDQNQLSKLESKIIQATASVGIAGKGFYSDFILYPVVTLNEIESHSQSMKNTISYSIDLGIFVKSVADGRIFSSYSKTLNGVGTNKSSALNNALNDFDPKSKDLYDFYVNTGDKILKYFESKCDDFISKADSYAKMGKYDEAIGLLMSIPNISSNCFNKVKTKSIEVYKLHLNKTCNSIILSAKGFYANREIESAIKTVCLIDPTSQCFKEAKEFLNTIEKDLKDKEKEEFQTNLKIYQDEIELEKIRIAAIKEIAIAYYSQKPSNYNYYDIVIKK
jgi:tetratricopeptide (TPR) repeat protein